MGLKSITILSLFLLAAIPAAIFAQSPVKITGIVTDRETGKPLPGANISVAGTGFGAVADEEGRYSLLDLPSGEYRLQVSFIGYRTELTRWIRIEPDHVVIQDFRLAVLPVQGEEIVVEGNRGGGETIMDATAEVALITAEDIKIGGYRSVGEALQGVSGVFVHSSGGAGAPQTVSIRGSKSEHVLVLLDGVRISKPHGGPADLSLIPLASIEKIAVVKGGNSAMFGADALGGIVSIETRNMHEAPVKQARAQAGSFGAIDASGTMGYTHNRLHLSGTYEYRGSEGDFSYRDSDGAVKKRENADFSMNSLFGKMRYAGDAQVITLTGFVNESDRGLPGFIYNLSSDARSVDVQRLFNLQVEKKQSERVELRVQSSYNGYTDKDEQVSYPPYKTEHKSFSLNGEAQARIKWSGDFTSVAGIAHRVDEGKLSFHQTIDAEAGVKINRIFEAQVYNEYTRVMNSPLERVSFVAAIRHSYVHRRKGYTMPKLGFSGLFAAPLSPKLRVNWSRSFHLPDFYDMYYEGYRSLGNPGLAPETGAAFDAGGELDFSLLGDGTFGASYFRNDIENLIYWRQRFDGVFTPVNLSRALIYGSEWKARWRTRGNMLSFDAGYTYMKALNKTGERTTHDKILTNRPLHMTSLEGTFRMRPFAFSLKHRLVSRRYIREANSKWIPPYSVVDILIGADLPRAESLLHAHFGIYNAGDTEYTIVERAPMPGREIRLTLEYTF